MEFIDIKKGTYLSVDQMNAIYNNFQYLKEKLENAGVSVGELIDNSVNYNISPSDILQKFNAVESNIQTIHRVLKSLLESDESYYKKFTWKPITIDKKSEIWRWIDWLYNAKNIYIYYDILCDINNDILTDNSGENIMVLTGKEK